MHRHIDECASETKLMKSILACAEQQVEPSQVNTAAVVSESYSLNVRTAI